MAMKKYIFIIAAVILAVACKKEASFPHREYTLQCSTSMAQKIVEGSKSHIGHVKSDKVYNLADGVKLLDLSYLTAAGETMRLCMYEVKVGAVSFSVTTPGDTAKLGKLEKLSHQVEAMAATRTVLGAVNGDSNNSSTLKPTSILYHSGKALKNTFDNEKCGFFAVLKDGGIVLGDQSEYETCRKNIYDAIGTQCRIMKNGIAMDSSFPDGSQKARTAVGVAANGSTVYLLVVDGVYSYYSNGISCSDLCAVMKAAGAVDVSLLEGDDASTAVYSDGGVIKVLNVPAPDKHFSFSDPDAIQKNIVNGLAIIKLQ